MFVSIKIHRRVHTKEIPTDKFFIHQILCDSFRPSRNVYFRAKINSGVLRVDVSRLRKNGRTSSPVRPALDSLVQRKEEGRKNQLWLEYFCGR